MGAYNFGSGNAPVPAYHVSQPLTDHHMEEYTVSLAQPLTTLWKVRQGHRLAIMAHSLAEVEEEAVSTRIAAETVEATGGLGSLGLNVKIFIAQLINFAIVVLVLWKWVYNPIVALLEKRQTTIEKSLKEAKEIEEKMGYNRHDYFIKIFKCYYGTTPGKYRDLVKEEL